MSIQNLIELNKQEIEDFQLFDDADCFSVKYRGGQSFLIDFETYQKVSPGFTKITGVYQKFGIYSTYSRKNGQGLYKLGSGQELAIFHDPFVSVKVYEDAGLYVCAPRGIYDLKTNEQIMPLAPNENFVMEEGKYMLANPFGDTEKWFDAKTHARIPDDDPRAESKLSKVNKYLGKNSSVRIANQEEGVFLNACIGENYGLYTVNGGNVIRLPSNLCAPESLSRKTIKDVLTEGIGFENYYGGGIYSAHDYRINNINDCALYDLVENKKISANGWGDDFYVFPDVGAYNMCEVFGEFLYRNLGGDEIFKISSVIYPKCSNNAIGCVGNKWNEPMQVVASKISGFADKAGEYARPTTKNEFLNDAFYGVAKLIECKQRDEQRKLRWRQMIGR